MIVPARSRRAPFNDTRLARRRPCLLACESIVSATIPATWCRVRVASESLLVYEVHEPDTRWSPVRILVRERLLKSSCHAGCPSRPATPTPAPVKAHHL